MLDEQPGPSSLARPSIPPSSPAREALIANSSPSPRSLANKPRLLWRSSLVLQDGTLLPGVAFASHIDPFSEHDTQAQDLQEAEASLCLALEMVRHRPLHITSISTDLGVTEQVEPSRRATISQPSFGARLQAIKTVHWISSGGIRVYIDPNEPSTHAFFERAFCSDPRLVSIQGGVSRTRKVFTISLGAATNAGQSDDIFTANIGSSSASSTRSELALFGQLIEPGQESASGVGRLEYDGHGTLSAPGKVLRLVIGRKVVTVRKTLSTGRELTRNKSSGHQTLNSVFSQAGLSLPQFGLDAAPLGGGGQRPDDPLPRGSIASLLQARAQRAKAANGHARGMTRSRSSSPFIEPSLPIRQRAFQRQPSRTSMESTLGMADEEELVPASLSSLARSAGSRGGSRTPGRRGEKRPQLSAIEEAESAADGLASPTKRRKQPSDRIQLPSSSLQSRLLAAANGRVSPVIKSESTTPERLSTPAPIAAAVNSSTSASAGPIEKSNRATMKKLVHSILINERGLQRTDEEYLICYTQAYSGTWCAFRRQGATVKLNKEAVEKVVRLHLGMYLDGAW